MYLQNWFAIPKISTKFLSGTNFKCIETIDQVWKILQLPTPKHGLSLHLCITALISSF